MGVVSEFDDVVAIDGESTWVGAVVRTGGLCWSVGHAEVMMPVSCDELLTVPAVAMVIPLYVITCTNPAHCMT